ncbi:MAG: PriCT-2 domain-containing protein [Candidatus Sabulitectum sp.]|nr:PriCT-2 domain-containing protein [Candidatus Sabulitectum sp.]
MTLYHNTQACQEALQHAHGNIILLQPQGKRPVMADWVSAPSKINGDGRAYLDLGYNLGFRIPKTHLIIDVDPRNGGDVRFKQLPQEVQDLPVTTVTAGGGFHIYTTLPEGYDYLTLRTKVEPEYKGIDFLHYGKQVVLPGSVLNEAAGWELGSDAEFPPPETPPSLLDILRRVAPEAGVVDLDSYLSAFELDQILAMIPVSQYQDNDSWLRLAMACHHATDGQGLSSFLSWSINDPMYQDQGEIITRRWDSMATGNTSVPVTIRTLVRELSAYGQVPSWLMVRAKMKSSPEEFFGVLEEKHEKTTDSFEALATQIDTEGNNTTLLTTMAAKIGMDSTITESMRILLIKKIATKTGATVTSIQKDIKMMVAPKYASADGETPVVEESADMSQPHTTAAQTAIAAMHSEGVPPAYCFGQWLKWDRQKWAAVGTEVEVRREAHRALYNQGTHATDSAIKSVVGIMQTMMEVPPEAFAPKPDDITVHTPLHTLKFINKQWVVVRPGPENRNLAYIGASYDPEAPAPVEWFSFLDKITTSPEARRTVACSIMYAAAQCRPWLRKAIYLYGPKRSGKSTMLNLIQDLLGHGNCSALNMRQLGGRFGGYSLVNKLANISNETVSKDTIQDDVFKALISGETIEVEQKFKQSILYSNTTKLFFGANGFPRVSDESDATWDRLTIISCPYSIGTKEGDPMMGKKLRQELSGILNWAMTIFQEEYTKDSCISVMNMDEDARDIMGRWRELNNPALRWAKERIMPLEGNNLSMPDAYNDYRMWCRDSGHKELNKIHFSRQVGQVVHRKRKGSGNVFEDVALAPIVSPHFDVLS